MPHIISLLIILLTGAASFQHADPPSLEHIKQMLVEGERAEAIELLEDLVQQGDPEEEALAILIDQYHQSYNFSQLIELYQQHQPKLEGNPAAVFSYAQAKYQTGFTGEAVRILEEMRAMDAADERGLILLGRIYYQDDQWEKALPVYEELTERMPANLYFRTQKARIHRMMQNRERSLELLHEIFENDETYLPAILEMTVTLYTANELDEVRELMDSALDLYPEESRLWNFSARTAYNQQQYHKAIEHWNREVELGETEASTFRGLALCYYLLEEHELALQHFEQALTRNPGDMTSLMYSAMVYRQLEDWEKAGSFLNKLYELHITDYFVDTLMQRAVVHEAQDDIDSAISDYKLARLLNPEQYHANFYIAALLDRHSNEKEEVIELYQTYLESPELDPELEEYARGRLRVLIEEMHFARGRE